MEEKYVHLKPPEGFIFTDKRTGKQYSEVICLECDGLLFELSEKNERI